MEADAIEFTRQLHDMFVCTSVHTFIHSRATFMLDRPRSTVMLCLIILCVCVTTSKYTNHLVMSPCRHVERTSIYI